MNTKEAANRLGVSVRRVQAMIGAGVLPAQKMGRDWFITEANVVKLMAEKRPPGRPKK